MHCAPTSSHSHWNCGGMRQVPRGVDSSNWCCELSLLLGGWSLVSSHVRRAPGVILLLLSDVLVNCTDCSRDIKAGD